MPYSYVVNYILCDTTTGHEGKFVCMLSHCIEDRLLCKLKLEKAGCKPKTVNGCFQSKSCASVLQVTCFKRHKFYFEG